jgi:hypothetical protein
MHDLLSGFVIFLPDWCADYSGNGEVRLARLGPPRFNEELFRDGAKAA